MRNETRIPIAVRAYSIPVERSARKEKKFAGRRQRPNAMLVWDTETTIDERQKLTFGSFRLIVDSDCVDEGIFHADNLRGRDLRKLQKYVAKQNADSICTIRTKLRLITRTQFVDMMFRVAYKGHCLIVGFNLNYDLSRVAVGYKDARGRFAGGFSLDIWSYFKDGVEFPDKYRPSICIKQIDSKRSLKGFTARRGPDPEDLIPDEPDEDPEYFRGHFLDLRTLAFALTDRSYTLEAACAAFGVEHGKQRVERHGEITDEYIDYNRRDVLATWELAVKLLEEYDRHPLALQETKAYSPASIGKGYLRQ
jgi:hypothetical protein